MATRIAHTMEQNIQQLQTQRPFVATVESCSTAGYSSSMTRSLTQQQVRFCPNTFPGLDLKKLF